MTSAFTKIFEKHSLKEYGFCQFDALPAPFNTRNAHLIPENAKTVITFLFPYKTPAPKKRNLSLY